MKPVEGMRSRTTVVTAEQVEEKAQLRKDREEGKVHDERASCAALFCRMLTVFMAFFIVTDVGAQLLMPSMPNTHAVIQRSAAAASAAASAAATAVASSLGGASVGFDADADAPVGEARMLTQDGVWEAPWGALETGQMTLTLSPSGKSFLARFPPPDLEGLHSDAPASKLASVHASVIPAFIIQPAAPAVVKAASPAAPAAPAALGAGTILQLRLRALPGGGADGVTDSVRALELSLGASGNGSSAVAWSQGALVYTLAAELLTAPSEFTEAQLPMPALSQPGAAWSHVRLRYMACDRWGHSIGDIDCDPASPPQPLVVELASAQLIPATPAARAAATRRLCEPALLLEGRGLSTLLPDVCPISALYKPLVMPADGKVSGLALAGSAGAVGGSRPLPLGGLEGRAQGYRCEEMMTRVSLGAKIARGWSRHKAVYRGIYRPPGGGRPLPVVVKEGGLRYPPPQPGERGVGFSANQSAAMQQATLGTMFFEMSAEVLISELLMSSHPGIPRQYGACMDAGSMLATSVQAMGAVHLNSKSDLAALAAGSSSPPAAALRLARSSVSLFHFLVEERALRLEDLHWQLYDLKGNVRLNFSELDSYGHDLSQFSVDSTDLESGLNLQLIDLDKILVSHDDELRWYIAEQMMPYVGVQLLDSLVATLPGLSVAIKRMLDPDPLQRPPSFKCIVDWLAAEDAASVLAKPAGPWPDLPCDPAVYNAGMRSRWENPHFG